MKKHKLFRLFAIFLAVLAVIPFTACNEEKKSEEAYRADVAASISEISGKENLLNQSIETFFSAVNEENRKAVLSAVEDLKSAYDKINEFKAPQKYAQMQDTFTNSAKTAMKAAEIYQKEFTEVTQKTFNEEFIKNISKGDELLKQANDKLLQVSESFAESSSKIQ